MPLEPLKNKRVADGGKRICYPIPLLLVRTFVVKPQAAKMEQKNGTKLVEVLASLLSMFPYLLTEKADISVDQ